MDFDTKENGRSIAIENRRIVFSSEEILLIELDCEQRCRIVAEGVEDYIPQIYLGFSTRPNDWMEISFVDFKGWDVFCASSAKTIVRVALTKGVE